MAECLLGNQENLWNVWGSVVNDWETVNKKKSSQIKVSIASNGSLFRHSGAIPPFKIGVS